MSKIGARTSYCAEVGENDVGKTVTVKGWAAKRRDLGGLIFVDLRDRTGILQVVFDASQIEEFALAESVRSEYVLAVTGTLRHRSAETVNPKLQTGAVEVLAHGLEILADSDTPPFAIDDADKVNELTRLKYRYLDLRTDGMTERTRLKSEIMFETRNFLHKRGFWEIETPYLGKSTPEGARDYLVPSRVKNGAFYALPQ